MIFLYFISCNSFIDTILIDRIYGDKAKDLLDGLKMKPFIGVPIALRRLKAKQQEWIEHRIKFNKVVAMLLIKIQH